jgi:hypothetical protein
MALLLNLPNPACCATDDPRHLCERCRAAYDAELRAVLNALLGANGNAARATDGREEMIHNSAFDVFDSDREFREQAGARRKWNERFSRRPAGERGGPVLLPQSSSNGVPSQSFTSVRLAVAIRLPSGLNATPVTKEVWPRRRRISWPVATSQRFTSPG